MAEAKIRDYVGIRDKRITVKETERGRLNRTAEVKRKLLQCVRQVRYDHFAHIAAGRAIQDEAESAFGVMLADQEDCSLKKRTAQLTAVEQQLSFQECLRFRHNRRVKSHLNESG